MRALTTEEKARGIVGRCVRCERPVFAGETRVIPTCYCHVVEQRTRGHGFVAVPEPAPPAATPVRDDGGWGWLGRIA